GMVQETASCRSHLCLSQEKPIAIVPALLDCLGAYLKPARQLGIARRKSEADQVFNLRLGLPGPRRRGGSLLVGPHRFRHRTDCVAGSPYPAKNPDLKCGSSAFLDPDTEPKGMPQYLGGIAVSESPPGVFRRQDEVSDGFRIVTRFFEMQ